MARWLVDPLAAAVLAMDRWPDLAHAGGNEASAPISDVTVP
jgi:hypothetical protein